MYTQTACCIDVITSLTIAALTRKPVVARCCLLAGKRMSSFMGVGSILSEGSLVLLLSLLLLQRLLLRLCLLLIHAVGAGKWAINNLFRVTTSPKCHPRGQLLSKLEA